VSRALKNHPDISAKTKAKVQALAQNLDYEPNASAIQLRTQTSKILGVIVPAIANLFYENFLDAVEEESRKNGYALMILQSNHNAENELNNLKIFRQNRVSGIFACLSANSENLDIYHKIVEQDMPIVFFDIVPKSNAFTKVRMADERCGVLAAKNIIKRNAKKVLAIFGDPALSISQIRKTSFQNLMMDLSPKTNVKYINATSSIEAEEIFKKNFYNKTAKLDTVFCMTDEILIGVMKAIQELQIKVPTEMGVISISNGFIPNLYFPVISYVETSGFQLGKFAFMQMMANLQTGKPVNELIVEAKLIEGGSM